jgi:MFS family permease
VAFVVYCVIFGSVSDRIGRRTMLFISVSLLFICVLPLFLLLQAYPATVTLVGMLTTFCVLVASFVGVAPAGISEIFPAGGAVDWDVHCLQRGVHYLWGLRAGDSHLVYASAGRVCFCSGVVRHAGCSGG